MGNKESGKDIYWFTAQFQVDRQNGGLRLGPVSRKYSTDCKELRAQPKLVEENLLIVYTNKETLSMQNCKGKSVDHLHEH